jgi:hypothetical protein
VPGKTPCHRNGGNKRPLNFSQEAVAVDRQKRQLGNGLLLMKQNKSASRIDIFDKVSNSLVAISARDCNAMNAMQLVGVRYDAANNPVGIGFIMAPSTIRLAKNRTRFPRGMPPNLQVISDTV